MNTKSEISAKPYHRVLSEALREGDMKQLADRVAQANPDKSFEGVYSYVSNAREGDRYFNVAASVVGECEPLLREVADRAGFLLVQKPEAGDAGASIADVARSGGALVALFMESFSDGRVTAEELVAIQALCNQYQAQVARLQTHAAVLNARERGAES